MCVDKWVRVCLLALFPFLLFACATAPRLKKLVPKERAPVTAEAKIAGGELGVSEVVEFSFPKGSAALTAVARKRLDEAFVKPEKITAVRILAWSDRESPPLKGNSLPKGDLALADRRIRAIQDLITPRTRGLEEVSTHNMAATASTLERLLQSPDYQVKESLRDSGVATEERRGTPMKGKALVMLLRGK